MALRGTNQELGRPYNRRIVLESIRNDGPAARGEIASRVGLTVQTVSTIVRELEELGYILPVREKPKGKGVPPTTLHLNPEGGYAIGISTTPVGIEAALLNLAGDVIGSATRSCASPKPDLAFAIIEDLVAEVIRLRPGGRLLGVGMAMPGPFDVQSMSFVGPTTMDGWSNVPVRARLEEITGLPAFIAVDTVAAALGVRLYGEGAAFSQFYYLHFSVGLGGTMMQDGVSIRGAWGNAGEIGHIPIVPDGLPCPCGNRGCLERYVSLDAFSRRPADQSETAWVEAVSSIFRNALTTVENLFDPETIILGGIIPPSVLARLAAAASDLPNSVSARYDRTTPRVLTAGGVQLVLRGAAALAVSGVLSPRFSPVFTPDRVRGRDPLGGIAA